MHVRRLREALTDIVHPERALHSCRVPSEPSYFEYRPVTSGPMVNQVTNPNMLGEHVGELDDRS